VGIRGAGHRKKNVGYMYYKCAIFDIKPT